MNQIYLWIVEACADFLGGIDRIMNHEPESTMFRRAVHALADWALTRYYATIDR